MEANEPITISVDKTVYHFDVREYLHQDDERCKYSVLLDGKLVASFEPDRHHIVHLCSNPGKLEEEVLHILADQIEVRHPR